MVNQLTKHKIRNELVSRSPIRAVQSPIIIGQNTLVFPRKNHRPSLSIRKIVEILRPSENNCAFRKLAREEPDELSVSGGEVP